MPFKSYLPYLLTIHATLLLVGCGNSSSSHQPDFCDAPHATNEVDRYENYLSQASKRGFSGSVLLAEGDSIRFRGNYGSVEARNEPTPFWIASISKPITAVAVLSLAQDGLLDLHKPIGNYLPAVPEKWRQVTPHHLLGHRSGLGVAYSVDDIEDRSEALKTILALDPVRPLGKFFYSNDGYNLLAILIEEVSGASFEQVVKKRVFDPAGMENAGFWGYEPVPSPVANVQDPSRDPRRGPNGESTAQWGYRGSTGIYATPEDLFRFVVALENGAILDPETVDNMLTSKNPSVGLDSQTYGYGWVINLKDGNRVRYWHAGTESELGHNGILDVRGKRIQVVLSNSGTPNFESDFSSWAQLINNGLHECADH